MPREEEVLSSELLSLRDLLRYGVSRFNAAQLYYGHGTDNAWDEAVALALHALHLPPETLEPFLDARLLGSEREQVLALFQRRITERLPAPYLTGVAWLRGLRFRVDTRVIVPRSPIAELLETHALAPWLPEPDAVASVLDLCTGSGCLAIFAALAYPNARVDAVDISAQALEVARVNVADHGLQPRINLHQSDALMSLPEHAYDLIICNPPYVNADSMAALPAEYRHEPELALAGGADGMALVARILADAPRYLRPNGLLVLEIGHEARHFRAAFPHIEPLWLATESARGDDTDGDTDDATHVMLLTRAQLL